MICMRDSAIVRRLEFGVTPWHMCIVEVLICCLYIVLLDQGALAITATMIVYFPALLERIVAI